MTRLNDMPAARGDVVTEGHARICREHGHATWTRDGEVVTRCPRCGDDVEVVGMVNAHMLGAEAAPGERVDWSAPDYMTRDGWLELLGVDVDEYAADHPHMIAFAVGVQDPVAPARRLNDLLAIADDDDLIISLSREDAINAFSLAVERLEQLECDGLVELRERLALVLAAVEL